MSEKTNLNQVGSLFKQDRQFYSSILSYKHDLTASKCNVCNTTLDDISQEIKLISSIYKSFKSDFLTVSMPIFPRGDLFTTEREISLIDYDSGDFNGRHLFIETKYPMNDELFSAFNVTFTEKDYSMCNVTFSLASGMFVDDMTI
jgi:hypothetical protein